MSKNRFGVDFKNVKAIYVAGKLNADAVGYLKNVSDMMEWANLLQKAGYATFIPAIDLLMGIKFGYDDYHQYFDNGQPWLLKSDMVFVCPGWGTSAGTRREIDLAIEHNIPVVFGLDKEDDPDHSLSLTRVKEAFFNQFIQNQTTH